MCSVHLDYSRMLLFLAGFITLISSRPAQLLADSCDWTVWDNTLEGRGVWNVHLTCHEGHVSWKNPYGALRVTLSPDTLVKHPFRLCFKATAHYNIGKISVEQEGSRGGELKPLVILSESQPAMVREYCLPPSLHPTILYVEALATGLNGLTIGHIELDYDMEYVTQKSSTTTDDTDECQPCSEKELLQAVCTSDFVIVGSVKSASQQPLFGETELALEVHKVYRQRQRLFTTSESADLKTVNTSPVNTYAPPVVETYDGHVIMPHKCSVHEGMGRFLFLGKIRLKRALVKCAPSLETFFEVWSRASKAGDVMCQLD